MSKILLDVMSGDNAPLAMLQGACNAAVAYPDISVTLVGDENVIRTVAAENNLNVKDFPILPSTEVITMEDDPIAVIHNKPNASLCVGLRALSDGLGDAFVSAGNTGALFTGGTLLVRKPRGIQRASIASELPTDPMVLLLDSGANVVAEPEYLLQFAEMGSAYMRKLCHLENPRVGLLNNGTESCKGTPVHQEAYRLLSTCPDVNFIGNVEANMLAGDVCDVLVADGFSGNVLLKTMEGVCRMLLGKMKRIYQTNAITKLSALAIKEPLGRLKKEYNPDEHGGAPILGLNKPVIKAHGSSNALAVQNAIRHAAEYAACGVMDEIALVGERSRARRQAQKQAEKQQAENENALKEEM